MRQPTNSAGTPLTDTQIDIVYNFFEFGGPRPRGVVLKNGFTETMGIYYTSNEKGHKKRYHDEPKTH